MNSLVIIPARAGSKGLKNKNSLKLNGKPLILHTVDEARKVFSDSEIYVSPDSAKIKNIVESSGLNFPFIRPSELATDFSSTMDVILHSLNHYLTTNKRKPDKIILLQPTSPLRSSKHIKEALNLFHNGLDLLVSVKETDSNPYYTLFEENDLGYLFKLKSSNSTRRQDCNKVYEFNGAIYIYNTDSILSKSFNEFNKIVKYKMCKYSSIDIDDKIDFLLAEILLKQ